MAPRNILLFAFILLTAYANAQTISGVVKDELQQPVPNVTVMVKNSFLATITGNDGQFSIRLPKAGIYTLSFNSTGYAPQETEINANTDSIPSLQVVLSKSISELKEVTVTASRKAEIIDRTPAAVQVISAKDIETQTQVNANIANILAQAVPALAFSTNATSTVGQTLRGRTPLIMIDGIPQSTPLRAGSRDIRTIDPSVIERIEVVKGATAIYGNGADGGIINYITKKATGKKFSAFTTLSNSGIPNAIKESLGARITQQFSGHFNKLDYIVTGSYEKTGVAKDADGVALTPVYGLGESDIVNAFTKLGYNLNAQNRIEAMYNYFGSAQDTKYIEKAGKYGITPTIGVKGTHKGEKEGTRYNHNAYVKYLSKSLPLHTSLDINAYLQSFYTIYGFSTYFENGGQSTISSNKKGLRLNLNTPYKVNGWWQGDVVYGVDIMNDATAQKLTDGRTWVPEMNLYNSAPYLQANATLAKDFILKAGYRYDHINIDVPSFTQVKDAAGNGGKFINGGKLSFNASTFNTGIRYAKWEAFKPFISFTQGFSIIDVGRYVRAAKENDIANMQIEPVKVNNYEAGFSSILGKVVLTGSYFISTNKIGASLTEENGLYVQQKAPEKTYGFEASADVNIIDALSVGAAYVYTEGKADINKNDRFDDPSDIYLNGTKISPPKATVYIKAKPAKSVDLFVQWLHFGDRNRFAVRPNGAYGYGEGPVKSNSVINFSGNWRLNQKISINAGIENLLNKDYYLPQSQWSAQNSNFIKANGIRYQLGIGVKW